MTSFRWQHRSSRSRSVAAGMRSLAPQSRQIRSTAERRISHSIAVAAAAAGNAVLAGSDVLELREDFVHDDIIDESFLIALAFLLLFLFRQDGQLPQVLFHRALRPDEAAKLLGLCTAQGGGTLQNPLRSADGGMGLTADAAGNGDVVFFAVKADVQRRLAAGAFDLCVGGFQRKNRPGAHHGLPTGGTEVAEGPHFLAHSMHLPCVGRTDFFISIKFKLYHIGKRLYSDFFRQDGRRRYTFGRGSQGRRRIYWRETARRRSMELIKRRLANLLAVKSLVTVILTVVFAYLAVTGHVSTEQFLTVFTVVIAFYFGTQAEKSSSGTDAASGGTQR